MVLRLDFKLLSESGFGIQIIFQSLRSSDLSHELRFQPAQSLTFSFKQANYAAPLTPEVARKMSLRRANRISQLPWRRAIGTRLYAAHSEYCDHRTC